MRPFAFLALLLLVPLVTGASSEDPSGDQVAYALDRPTSATGVCQDDATDIVALGAETVGTTFELRLTVVDLLAPSASCAGNDMRPLVLSRTHDVLGRFGTGGVLFVTDGWGGEPGFICSFPAESWCGRVTVSLHVEGNSLVWSLPVTGSSGDRAWDVRGLELELTGRARTHVGTPSPFWVSPMDIRDETERLNVTM